MIDIVVIHPETGEILLANEIIEHDGEVRFTEDGTLYVKEVIEYEHAREHKFLLDENGVLHVSELIESNIAYKDWVVINIDDVVSDFELSEEMANSIEAITAISNSAYAIAAVESSTIAKNALKDSPLIENLVFDAPTSSSDIKKITDRKVYVVNAVRTGGSNISTAGITVEFTTGLIEPETESQSIVGQSELFINRFFEPMNWQYVGFSAFGVREWTFSVIYLN